jgi:hypothetical protein
VTFVVASLAGCFDFEHSRGEKIICSKTDGNEVSGESIRVSSRQLLGPNGMMNYKMVKYTAEN